MNSIRETVVDKVTKLAKEVARSRQAEWDAILHATAHKEKLVDGYWQPRYDAEQRLNAALALLDAFGDVQAMPPIVVSETTKPERSRKMYYEVNYGSPPLGA